MVEHRRQPLLLRGPFALRLMRYGLTAFGIVALSLAIGVWGYMRFGGLPLTDAFLNASMILGGMGPVDASFYALFSGIALLTTMAVLLAPVVHRMLHALHLDDDTKDD